LCIPSTRSLRYESESKLEQCCVAAEAADLRSPSGSAVDRPQQLHCRVGPPIESVGDAAHTRCRWGGIALQSSISRRDANLASVSGDHLTSVFVDADPDGAPRLADRQIEFEFFAQSSRPSHRLQLSKQELIARPLNSWLRYTSLLDRGAPP